MSTPCTTCGEPLDPAADRCATCEAPASSADASVVAADPTRADDAPPWSIPIREPATASRRPAERAPRRSPRLALAAAAVVLLAVVLASRVIGSDDDAGTASGDAGQPAADETGGFDPGFAPRETTTTTPTAAPPDTAAPEPDVAAGPDPGSTSPTVAPVPTVPPGQTSTTAFAARTGPNGTGSVPALSTGFRGWLAQLTSVPYAAGTDGLADEFRRLQGSVPGAVAARSDDWSAFRDGFWVLVDPGPFTSPEEVRAFCAAAGFDGEGACLPRELRG